MPWTMNDYPQTWKHLDELERKKAIDIANAMLKTATKRETLFLLQQNKQKNGTKMPVKKNQKN